MIFVYVMMSSQVTCADFAQGILQPSGQVVLTFWCQAQYCLHVLRRVRLNPVAYNQQLLQVCQRACLISQTELFPLFKARSHQLFQEQSNVRFIDLSARPARLDVH